MKLYIALPALNEYEYIDKTIECISKQKTEIKFEVYVCVNQPEHWWTDEDSKIKICEDNQRTIEYLKGVKDIALTIIDRSSKGKGFDKDKYGVGWARKILMDTINATADNDDIILSLDSDTVFSKDYFRSITESFNEQSKAVAMSIPYYHNLTENESVNRAILRYEIYMRTYILNLLRIGSPYSFTALGSALALPVHAYRSVRGLTPKKSGEDFYFLQKLCKFGKVIISNMETVNPMARPSERVLFGTGPAIIKGLNNDWNSYPIYNYNLFDDIKQTYSLFSKLFKTDAETPLSGFLKEQFRNNDIWKELRSNNKDENRFIKACHTKIDGLRILQYLKSKNNSQNPNNPNQDDDSNLIKFLRKFYQKEIKAINIDISRLSLDGSSLEDLNCIRDFLFNEEMRERGKHIYTGIRN